MAQGVSQADPPLGFPWGSPFIPDLTLVIHRFQYMQSGWHPCSWEPFQVSTCELPRGRSSLDRMLRGPYQHHRPLWGHGQTHCPPVVAGEKGNRISRTVAMKSGARYLPGWSPSVCPSSHRAVADLAPVILLWSLEAEHGVGKAWAGVLGRQKWVDQREDTGVWPQSSPCRWN